MLANLILSGREWLWPAGGAFLTALLLLWWSYRRAPEGVARWTCPLLKALGFTALLFCLLEPLWSGQRARPGANLFIVVADNSQGLQIKDAGEQRSRGQMLAGLLEAKTTDWQSELEENFEVRRYLFDSRLQPTRDFSELNFEGRSSAMGSALKNIQERFRGRPIAGILLMTDGNATDLRAAPDMTGWPPVYPVTIGRADSIRDLALAQVRTTQTDFEDAPVNVQVDVSAAGYRGENVAVQVVDPVGKVVAEQQMKARTDEDTLPFRFQIRPEKPGLSFYRLQVHARGESTAATGADSSEATLANNQGYLAVGRGGGPYRVLYVSGRPNWEFKFLNRAVQEDPQLQLTGLIRAARREPKFNFIGRAGETSNPLFRGFGTQSPEEVERYDQPVLVRLNTKDERELRTGFPIAAEDLYVYHAVIVGDLEAEFFSPDQAALLQRFVSERGGGFLMLGGMESFQQGKYFRTPVGDMLPVYLDQAQQAAGGPQRMELTREGLLQSWARVRDNESDEKERLRSMTPFQVLNPVREIKPGASVIATVTDSQGVSRPALVTQRFGHGRTAALMVGDLWRWGLHDEAAHADMDKTWRQFIRWLVTDAPNRVDVAAEPRPLEGDGAVSLQVRVRDEKFQPLDNATVSVEVKPVLVDAAGGAQTNVIRLPAEPEPSEPGLYQVSYVSRGAGAFQASAVATQEGGVEVGRAKTGWATDLASEEFFSLKPNVALLEEIARRSGGQMVKPSELMSFARSMPTRSAPVMEGWTYPVWHTPALFAFALSCFIGEWGIRRWKGLP